MREKNKKNDRYLISYVSITLSKFLNIHFGEQNKVEPIFNFYNFI